MADNLLFHSLPDLKFLYASQAGFAIIFYIAKQYSGIIDPINPFRTPVATIERQGRAR